MGKGFGTSERGRISNSAAWVERAYQQLCDDYAVESLTPGRALIWDNPRQRYFAITSSGCTCAQRAEGLCIHQRFLQLYAQFKGRKTAASNLAIVEQWAPNHYTFSRELPNVPATASEATYLARLGVHPVTVDPDYVSDEKWSDIYEQLDIVLLWGGYDLPPQWSGGQERRNPTPRDRFELLLTRWAVENGKPLLGICRGHQVLNVALGGTLIQDIPDAYPRHLYRRRKDHAAGRHEIVTAPGSQMEQLFGARTIVNSYHHQAIDKLAPCLRVAARSNDGTNPDCALRGRGKGDGIIEAVEHVDTPRIIGVQFHPEMMAGGQLRKVLESVLGDWQPQPRQYRLAA